MTNDPEGALDRLRTQIETTDDLAEADREALLTFSQRLDLLQSEYSTQRHEKLLRHCAIMAGLAQRIDAEELPDARLVDALEDEDTRDELLAWINRRYDAPDTNRDYRVALRMFGRHVTDDDEVPDIFEDIPTGTSRNGPPMPDPGEMLDWHDDVVPMIEATHNTRDAALIAVAWDSGARSGELRELTVGDVSDHDHGLRITVDGKTGQRTITLMPSVPHLNRWLADHPTGIDDDPLWSKLKSPEMPSYQQHKKILDDAADRAGVTKPTTFTNFRKSSAAYLASRGMNQAHIEEHHGWRHGSTVASRYIRVFSEDADKQLAAIHGADVDQDDPEPIAPIDCPRCGKENPRDEPACVFCGQALEAGAADRIQENEREVRNATLKFASEHPGLIDDVGDLERLMELFDADADLAADADRIATVIDS
jgi:integrase